MAKNVFWVSPADFGQYVLIYPDTVAEQRGLVTGWRFIHHQSIEAKNRWDKYHAALLRVVTMEGAEFWFREDEIEVQHARLIGMEFFLPFEDGDEVFWDWEGGEVRGWIVTLSDYDATLTYRVHLFNTPDEDEIEVDERDLDLLHGPRPVPPPRQDDEMSPW